MNNFGSEETCDALTTVKCACKQFSSQFVFRSNKQQKRGSHDTMCAIQSVGPKADVDSLAHFNLHCRIESDIVSTLGKHNELMRKSTEFEFKNS